MRDKPRDALAIATRSQRFALLGAFCGSVLIGGLAAAVCESGAWNITSNSAPPQRVAATQPGEGVPLPPARTAGGGKVRADARLIQASVADVGLTIPLRRRAATAGQDPLARSTAGAAEAAVSEPERILPSPVAPAAAADQTESRNAADEPANGQNADAETTYRLASVTEGLPLATRRLDAEARTGIGRLDPVVECLAADVCIDDYLWSLYEKTPKIDTNKVSERIKVVITRKGKSKTRFKVVTKYVTGDFGWKDPAAAEKAGMPLKDYVIGGMDPAFKVQLYHALRAMEAAGYMPGITSAFRDDYRQSIAIGKKAASDSSYHGGSRRGGYGHGLAADLVSLKGDTRAERFVSSKELWAWIDANEKELGIGRPYLDRDPPHVAPRDGKEYADKRGAKARIARARSAP